MRKKVGKCVDFYTTHTFHQLFSRMHFPVVAVATMKQLVGNFRLENKPRAKSNHTVPALLRTRRVLFKPREVMFIIKKVTPKSTTYHICHSSIEYQHCLQGRAQSAGKRKRLAAQ